MPTPQPNLNIISTFYNFIDMHTKKKMKEIIKQRKQQKKKRGRSHLNSMQKLKRI